ncbi:leucine-rich repeat-containing protein 4B [Phlebotomus argentipes]|uniref:leucine-rich repeat-containing protein 4B n=1 Tax=Phlebotomus argentipes TaxID=94469 RepID=UPI002892F3CB|nr:leucine-rich repeat-containing protein 4B [Phlebotomus argentipes]
MERVWTIVLTLLAILVAHCAAIAAFCPPDRDIAPISGDNDDSPASFCDCHMAHTAPWGLPAVTIDCQGRELLSADLEDLLLPVAAEELTLAWNNLTSAPTLSANQHLRTLTLAHNAIASVEGAPFARLPNLRLLDLSSNDIATLSDDAFEGLPHLEHLSLARNRLKGLPSNVFSGLFVLGHLSLSENPLADFLSQENLFSYTGITRDLKTLQVAKCNLSKIHLDEDWPVSKLVLSSNLFQGVPDIPISVRSLDFGGNLLKRIEPDTFPPLPELEELQLDNMRLLKTVKADAFLSVSSKLRRLSLEGCRNLTAFDVFALGNSTRDEYPLPLQEVSLRGCRLRKIPAITFSRAENLTRVQLAGNPLTCDCDVEWIHDLDHDTGAQCGLPVILRGTLIAELDMEQFHCDTVKSWFYNILNGLIVFVLLCVCGVAIYFIVMRLKPSRRHAVQKLAMASPYARVTIQPNRAEHL